MSINFKFPLSKGPNGYFELNEKIEDGIIEDAKMLLLTNPGERVCFPQYGIGLNQYLFEPQTAETKIKLQSEIIQQSLRYLPLVTSVKPTIYFKQDITLGNPLYGQVVFDNDNGFFLTILLTLTPPSKKFQVTKQFGLMIQPH